MNIISNDVVSAADVLHILENREDLEGRQQTALEHLKKHIRVQDPETVEELASELEDSGFSAAQILKIIETLPRTEREVTSLFSKERVKLEDDDVGQILSFVDSVAEQ